MAWHINRIGTTRNLTLLMSFSGSGVTGAFSDLVVEGYAVSDNSDFSIPGICLAKSQLYGETGTTSSKNLSTTETMIESVPVLDDYLIGILLTGVTTANADCNLRVRVVVESRTGSRGNWSDSVTPAPNFLGTPPPPQQNATHVRGSWPKNRSTFLAFEGEFDVNPEGSGPLTKEFTVCRGGGVEQQAYTDANDPNATQNGNKGLYGVNLFYKIQLKNTHATQLHDAFVGMYPRGGNYWGAGRVAEPTWYAALGIPKLIITQGQPRPMCLFAYADPPAAQQRIRVPANSSLTAYLAIANGGSAALPTNVVIGRSDYEVTFPEEPGDQ